MEGQDLDHRYHLTHFSEMRKRKDNASYKYSMLSLLFYLNVVNDLLKLVLVVPCLSVGISFTSIFMKTFSLKTVFAKLFVEIIKVKSGNR